MYTPQSLGDKAQVCAKETTFKMNVLWHTRIPVVYIPASSVQTGRGFTQNPRNTGLSFLSLAPADTRVETGELFFIT